MKKTMKRVASVAAVILLFLGCMNGMRFLLTDDTSSYTRLMMHELYHTKENIDLAFVGSSHVYRSLVPEVTDAGFGAHTFNLGTSSQPMDGSLALIRELAAGNEVRQIYLEMYYGIASMCSYQERTELTSVYIISDYMKPSLRRLSFLTQAVPKPYWPDGFLLARRNWKKFFDADYVKNVIAAKQTESYRNCTWVKSEGQTEYYVERGFVANDAVAPENGFYPSAYSPVLLDEISDDWKRSLRQIIRFCKKKNIALTLFISPMQEAVIAGKGNYDAYHQLVRQIAKEEQLEFYDFNLVKPQYFITAGNRYFKDEDHLNTAGAYAFSRLFGDFFTGKIAQEDLFYDSFEEKLAGTKPSVYGLAGFYEDAGAGTKYARIISSRPSGMEYRISVRTQAGEERALQDFSENTQIALPLEEQGVLTIRWRMKENPEQGGELELVYE